jgi:hypothetical protein
VGGSGESDEQRRFHGWTDALFEGKDSAYPAASGASRRLKPFAAAGAGRLQPQAVCKVCVPCKQCKGFPSSQAENQPRHPPLHYAFRSARLPIHDSWDRANLPVGSGGGGMSLVLHGMGVTCAVLEGSKIDEHPFPILDGRDALV